MELERELENDGRDILCKQYDKASGAGSGLVGAGPVWRSFLQHHEGSENCSNVENRTGMVS